VAADAIVRARIDAETKQRAGAALDAMGLSISDAIRLLMLRIADEQRLPFAVKVPNAATRKAMKELETTGKRKTYANAAAMLKDFGV
jgi:DNA-damage-inducible protein J